MRASTQDHLATDPSGIIAPVSLAPVNFASVNLALNRFAPLRFAPSTNALRRSASLRFAPVRFTPTMFASVRFAPVRFALCRSVPHSFAFVRFAPDKSTSARPDENEGRANKPHCGGHDVVVISIDNFLFLRNVRERHNYQEGWNDRDQKSNKEG